MSHGTQAQKFTEGRLAQVLIAPIVSEKATSVAEKHNQVLFKVLRDATKPEIKAAVELLFKVEVEAVNVVNQKGKSKRFGGRIGRRAKSSTSPGRLRNHGRRQSQTHFPRPTRRGQSGAQAPAQGRA
jgi:large subunit ribosomal protein L23